MPEIRLGFGLLCLRQSYATTPLRRETPTLKAMAVISTRLGMPQVTPLVEGLRHTMSIHLETE